MDDEPNLGVLLFLPYRAMENRVIAALREAGVELTVAQMKIVQRIGPNGTRLTDLAEQAQVTKQTAGFLVDQIERQGFVERVPDPTDARARLIRISPSGEQMLPVAGAAVAEVEAEWSRHLGPKKLLALREILSDLRTITDPWAP
ncbi:MarR family winged helix-turn-helix transcriptional regulator [Aldersonia kunmingensis]|uniref:MarR family winged helix-turn-helix transcriptional regulator n=1 Tax=Aldersonia kunmingensis TaxID=408066 RepID=UPI000AF05422|nr:MarR family transcriptional regulator [Aldersonia kunmingensis]